MSKSEERERGEGRGREGERGSVAGRGRRDLNGECQPIPESHRDLRTKIRLTPHWGRARGQSGQGDQAARSTRGRKMR